MKLFPLPLQIVVILFTHLNYIWRVEQHEKKRKEGKKPIPLNKKKLFAPGECVVALLSSGGAAFLSLFSPGVVHTGCFLSNTSQCSQKRSGGGRRRKKNFPRLLYEKLSISVDRLFHSLFTVFHQVPGRHQIYIVLHLHLKPFIFSLLFLFLPAIRIENPCVQRATACNCHGLRPSLPSESRPGRNHRTSCPGASDEGWLLHFLLRDASHYSDAKKEEKKSFDYSRYLCLSRRMQRQRAGSHAEDSLFCVYTAHHGRSSYHHSFYI